MQHFITIILRSQCQRLAVIQALKIIKGGLQWDKFDHYANASTCSKKAKLMSTNYSLLKDEFFFEWGWDLYIGFFYIRALC